MTLNEYQQHALETAIYPAESRIVYPTLGLTGEAGEVADKVKKVIRDTHGEFTPEKKQEAAFTVHLDSEDYPTVSVTFYQYDGEDCLVQLDGQTLGLVSRSLVVDLTEAVNAITLGLS